MRPESGPSKPKLLLTVRETAEALGISPRTLWSLTAPRGPLPAVRIRRRVFYRVQDLDEFISKQLVAPPEDDTNGNPRC
jgi:excisionase family DNA binding protein